MSKYMKFYLLCAFLLAQLTSYAYDFEAGGIYYNITSSGDNKTCEVTNGPTKYSGAVTIPATVTTNDTETYSVTKIGYVAFAYCPDLTSITIPSSVTSIALYAFVNCTGLTSLNIPCNVDYIDEFMFFGCSDLASITVADGNTKYDSRDNCNAIIETSTNKLIYGCKNTTIPAMVTGIGDSAFQNCTGLTSISIPGSVTSIGDNAFDGCENLISISLPQSTTPPTLGDSAFDGLNKSTCQITVPSQFVNTYKNATGWADFSSITAPAYDFEVDGIYYNITSSKNKTCEVTYGTSKYTGNVTIPSSVTCGSATYSVTSIARWAFYYCLRLTSINIPCNVEYIDDSAFEFCSGLATITVAAGNTKYDSRDNCNAIIETSTNKLICGFKNSTIPATVTSIGHGAFYSCTGLTSITIPDNVTSIGEYAFEDCENLASISLPKSTTPPTLGNNAFKGVNKSTCQLTVPSQFVNTYKNASGWEDFSNITAPTYDFEVNGFYYNFTSSENKTCEVTYGPSAYTNANVTIPASVTFESVSYSVTGIGESAFQDCTDLISISIPNCVESIGDNAFYGCKKLVNIPLPESLTTISYCAFRGCTSLFSVTIPSSVTSIISTAFIGCPVLETITVADGNTTYDSRDNCNAIIETSSNTLVCGCKKSTIPSTVTSIGDYAFQNCTGLTSIIIPASVNSIDRFAFNGCTGLQTIYDKRRSHQYLGREAFDGVDKTTCQLFVPKSCADSYKNADGWKDFTNINEFDIDFDFTVNGIYYNITSGENQTCEVTSNPANYSGTITIPNTVTYNSVKYTVNRIGDYAFYGCSDLQTIYVNETTPPTLGASVFEGVNKTSCQIIVPKSCVDTYRNAAGWADFSAISPIFTFESGGIYYIFTSDEQTTCEVACGLSRYSGNVSIPASVNYHMTTCAVTGISDYAFWYCPGLTSVTIPSSVTNISSTAIQGCSALASITVADGNTTYDSRDNCNAIIETSTSKLILGCKNSTIPASVASIGDYAFKNCSGLTSLTFNSCPSIGNEAFDGIPSSATFTMSLTDGSYVATSGTLPTLTTAPTYTRSMKNEWGTLVVPFDIVSDNDNTYYVLKSVDSNSLTLTNMNHVPAGTPVLVRRVSDNTSIYTDTGITVTASGTALNTTINNPSAVNGLTLTGTYTTTELTSQTGYIIATNKFWNIQTLAGSSNKVYVAPFRAYLAGTVSNGVKELTIGTGEEDEETSDAILAPLNDLDRAAIYDLSGRRLPDLQPGINIVRYPDGTTKKITLK